MPIAKLTTKNGQEIKFDGAVAISIGREPSGNLISFPDDTNVSRSHAKVELRDGDFWLIDLGSSNGTTVNGTRVTSEMLLKDGDQILLGGTSEVSFELEKEKSAESAAETGGISAGETESAADKKTETEIAKETETASKMPVMLGVMGLVCGLAVVCVVAAVLYSWTSEKKCSATAIITSPENGEVISKETEIKAKVQNGECVQRVIFVLENKEIASADSEPYRTSLEPDEFAGYASDGQVHSLNVVLEDAKGNKTVQEGSVQLVFETLATPTPTPEETPQTAPTPKKAQQNKQIMLADVQKMSNSLLQQFSGSSNYKLNQDFLQAVQKKTADYVSDGYYERAKGTNNAVSDTINVAFVKEQNIDAPLGYFLAMSRSKFNPQKQGANEGMWQMSNDFATANSLNGMCGTETLSDPTQNCAARVAALYMKYLLANVFDRDVVYSVAAFGMSPNEAAAWKSSLPADRSDFWNVIKSPQQRDEVVKFFAAGIVAENPQRFGLKKDQPLDGLYKIAMGN